MKKEKFLNRESGWARSKAEKLFELAEISDYSCEEQADGFHFRIKTTLEHI